jgi:hypothetical protein
VPGVRRKRGPIEIFSLFPLAAGDGSRLDRRWLPDRRKIHLFVPLLEKHFPAGLPLRHPPLNDINNNKYLQARDRYFISVHLLQLVCSYTFLVFCYTRSPISHPVWQPGSGMKAANRSSDESIPDPYKKSADMAAGREDLPSRPFPWEFHLDSFLIWKGKRMKRTALFLCLVFGLIHPGTISSGPVNPGSSRETGKAVIKPYVSGDHRARQDRGLPQNDAVPEPGTLLLFGAGIIALTCQLKFRTFDRR